MSRIPEGDFTVYDEWRLPIEMREQMWRWLEAVTGMTMKELATPKIELHGEGQVIVHRYDLGAMKTSTEVVYFTQTFQASVPPPVWHDRENEPQEWGSNFRPEIGRNDAVARSDEGMWHGNTDLLPSRESE